MNNEPFLEFEDYPSTNTPLSATNLNNMQVSIADSIDTVDTKIDTEVGTLSNLETTDQTSIVNAINEIYNDNYYKPGDTYDVTGYTAVVGYITSSNKNLNFSIELPKSLKNINTITITTMVIDVRVPAGAYAVNNFSIFDSSVTGRSATKRDDRCIDISLKRSSNWYGTNNIPVSIAIYTNASISFS